MEGLEEEIGRGLTTQLTPVTSLGDGAVQVISPLASGEIRQRFFKASLGERWPFNQQLRDRLRTRGKAV